MLIAIWGVTSVIAQELIVFWPLVPIGFMAVFTCMGAFGRRPPRSGEVPRPPLSTGPPEAARTGPAGFSAGGPRRRPGAPPGRAQPAACSHRTGAPSPA
ncbi:hypothetical protein ACFQXA_14275 [Nocardiopsis composta]